MTGGVRGRRTKVVVAAEDFPAAVIDQDLEVHLRLAAQTLDVGQEVALVGADGAAQGVVIRERGAEPEGQHRGPVEAAGDDAGMVAGRTLAFGRGQAGRVLGEMLGNDDGEIGGGKEEDLVTEEAVDSVQRHRSTVAGQL